MKKNHKIVSLKVQNVMKVKAAEVYPDGPTVVVGGKNGNGKTSLIQSIAMALGGRAAVPREPIREGEEHAEIVLELADLVVRRVFTAGGKSFLSVESHDGAAYRSPQALLDRLYSNLTFDPVEFARMKPQDQADTLRRLAKLDLTELDKRRAGLYEERTETNRGWKALDAEYSAREYHEGVPAEPVSVEALVEELSAIEKKNKQIERDRTTAKFHQEQIAELEQKINDHRAALDQIPTRLYDGSDPSPIREQIVAAEATNRKIRENHETNRIADRLNLTRGRSKELTAMIEKVDRERAEMIAAASLPVDGLGFDPDGRVTFNGLPFEQASSADQLRVSVAMGLAMNPELRVILIRDGSLLDDDNLKMIADMAEAADAQVWIERVGEGEECSVVMVDGEIKPKAEVPQ